MAKTRSKTDDFVLGKPAGLPINQLPSKLDVLKCYLFELHKVSETDRDGTVKNKIIIEVANNVKYIWNLASIPTTSDQLINKAIAYLIQKHSVFSKKLNKNRDNSVKIETFCKELEILFDICACACYKPKFGKQTNWKTVKLSDCLCVSAEAKIPESEWEFYVDQHLGKKLFIANSVDKVTTEQMRKRQEQLERRREKEERKRAHFVVPQQLPAVVQLSQSELAVESCTFDELSVDSNPSSDGSSEEDYEYKIEAVQNRKEYPNFIAAVRRYNVSNRAAAAVANALLLDLGT